MLLLLLARGVKSARHAGRRCFVVSVHPVDYSRSTARRRPTCAPSGTTIRLHGYPLPPPCTATFPPSSPPPLSVPRAPLLRLVRDTSLPRARCAEVSKRPRRRRRRRRRYRCVVRYTQVYRTCVRVQCVQYVRDKRVRHRRHLPFVHRVCMCMCVLYSLSLVCSLVRYLRFSLTLDTACTRGACRRTPRDACRAAEQRSMRYRERVVTDNDVDIRDVEPIGRSATSRRNR